MIPGIKWIRFLLVLSFLFSLCSCKENMKTEEPVGTAYILYYTYEYTVRSGGIINTSTGEINAIMDGYYPVGWSPTGIHLLLRSSELYQKAYPQKPFYIGNWDGTDPQQLPEPETGFICTTPSWLTDEILIVTACYEFDGDWHTTLYDLKTGEYTVVPNHKIGRIVAVSPETKKWVEESDGIDLVDMDGSRTTISDEYFRVGSTYDPYFDPVFFFLKGGMIISKGCIPEGDGSECGFTRSTIDHITDEAELIYSTQDIVNFKPSPDGKYLAYVDHSNWINIIDVEMHTVEYKWMWNDIKGGPPNFIWSPDSSTIALGSSERTSAVFSLLDFRSGEETELVNFSNAYGVLLEWKLFDKK